MIRYGIPISTGERNSVPISYILSDSVGETAELVPRAAASQFNGGSVEIRLVPYVNDPRESPKITQEVKENHGMVYTLYCLN